MSLNGDTQIRNTSYVQPTKRNREYYDDLCDDIADMNKYVNIVAGLTKPYIWIPMTYFGFDTSALSDILSNGRVETTEDRTLHFKDAYVYENGNWWLGAISKRLHTNLITSTIWRDSNNDTLSVTETENFNYYSPNYYNETNLRALALQYYDSYDGHYFENYSETSKEYLN